MSPKCPECRYAEMKPLKRRASLQPDDFNYDHIDIYEFYRCPECGHQSHGVKIDTVEVKCK